MELPRTISNHDAIWVIVGKLTTLAHFLPMKTIDPLDKLAKLYINEVISLHGIPVLVISDR